MGLDLFAAPDTTIYAPLAGTVHAVSANPEPLDYGYVLILKHETPEGLPFYTLYGHLKTEVLGLQKGQKICSGQEIARIGDWPENGGWAPHLHFQIIRDLLDLGTDFPGVAKASELTIWQAFCPNPNLLVRLPEKLATYQAASKDKTLQERKSRIGRNLNQIESCFEGNIARFVGGNDASILVFLIDEHHFSNTYVPVNTIIWRMILPSLSCTRSLYHLGLNNSYHSVTRAKYPGNSPV